MSVMEPIFGFYPKPDFMAIFHCLVTKTNSCLIQWNI